MTALGIATRQPSVAPDAARASLAKLSGLQVLRGLAAAMVVAFHANPFFGPSGMIPGSDLGRVFTFGHAGVDLFFVLSGFIIAHAHWSDPSTLPAIRRYIWRRVIRIYPFMILVVLALLASTGPVRAWLHDPDFFPYDAVRIVSSLTLIPATCSYFPSVLWSLQCEVYFYVIFLSFYIDRRLFLAALLSWAVLSIGNSAIKLAPALSSCASSPLSIYNGLFAGGVTAYLLSQRFHAGAVQSYFKVAIGLGLAVFAGTAIIDVLYAGPVYLGAETAPVPMRISAVTRGGYGLGAMLLIFGAAVSRWLPVSAIGRAAVLLGDASFAIYLVHLPILGILGRLLSSPMPNPLIGSVARLALMLAASLAFGLALHLAVEKPLLKSLRSFRPFS